MKKSIIALGFCVTAVTALSQQIGQYSQYLNNQFIMNPAAAGEHDYFDVDLSFRQQWVGFDNAPQNYYLSGHTPLGKKKAPISNSSLRLSQPNEAVVDLSGLDVGGTLKHGIGGIIAADNYGPFKRLNFNLAYALHLPITKKVYWSFGAKVGLSNLSFDESQISLVNSNDATFNQFSASTQRLNLFDVNLGTYIYSNKFYFGYSSNQMLQNKIYFGDAPIEGKLNVHHFVTGGYNFDLNEKLVITPGFLIKYMNPVPVSFDLNAKLTYDDKYFIGISYRNKDAIIGMLGAYINDMIKIGYSFDYTTSAINEFSSGGHEILLGIMLNKKK